MKEKYRIFKWLSIPVLLFILALAPVSYMAWKEYSINNELVEHSLKGNPVAIEIMVKYEKPWKLDERLIREAIAGNENAIKVLGITTTKKN
jgi:hypothetical protein